MRRRRSDARRCDPRQHAVVPPRRQARAGDRRRARHRACGRVGAGGSRRACDAPSRTRDEIEEAAAAIRARGQQADALALDVTDSPAMQAAIAAAEPFNILVNNAGTNRPKPLMDVTDRGLRRHHGAERARGLFRRAGGGAAADRGEASRLDHQHLVADGPCRRGATARSIAPQARDGGLHQGDGDRARRRTTSASTRSARPSSRRR